MDFQKRFFLILFLHLPSRLAHVASNCSIPFAQSLPRAGLAAMDNNDCSSPLSPFGRLFLSIRSFLSGGEYTCVAMPLQFLTRLQQLFGFVPASDTAEELFANTTRFEDVSFVVLLSRTADRLVVLAVEVAGRWSSETNIFLRLLAAARARSETPLLHRRVEQAWRLRWSGMLACAEAASSLGPADQRGQSRSYTFSGRSAH